MKKTAIVSVILSVVLLLPAIARSGGPADPLAAPEARRLFERLAGLQEKGVMYGHQDDLVCGTTWRDEDDRSDVKEAVGDYPAVAGFELGELETGRERSLDWVSFAHITRQVKMFHKMNGIITVSWHATNPITSQWEGKKAPNGAGSAWDVPARGDSLQNRGEVRSILPGGANHAMFNEWLGRLADYFLTWRDEAGTLIPFIFRPYHEHSGSFFWWGETRCTDEEYAELWRYTVDFMRGKGLHNILWAYNTDKVYSPEQYMRGYPGDDYVDMLSIDWYGSGPEFNVPIDNALGFCSAIAESKGKLFALSECGNIRQDLVDILSRHKVSYFLTWRNHYRPDPATREANPDNNEELLRSMYEHPATLFLSDIQE